MLKVTNALDVYEIDGQRPESGKARPTLDIMSHWVDHYMVVLVVDGHAYKVHGKELVLAVENAMNWKQYL